jgi:peptide/nickel transport system substrate-binding protein
MKAQSLISLSPWERVGVRALRRRRLLQVAAAGSAAAVLAAACGGRGGTSTQSPSAKTVGKPKPGGQLNVRQLTDPFDFDPTGKPTNNRAPMAYAYDSLLSFKSGPDVAFYDVKIQPGIAERYEAPDGTTFTFHLRRNVKFANLPPVNGRPVTSADVKWSMEYVARLGAIKDDKKLFPGLYSDSFQGLTSIQTPDDYTVVFKFSEPLAPFVNYSAAEWNPVLAHEIYEQEGNFSNRLVGTGPFQIDEASSRNGEHSVYKRNPTYFLDGRPYLDQINEIDLKDDATALAAFQTKQLDLIPSRTVAGVGGIDVVKRTVPDAVVFEDMEKSKLLVMGTEKPPLNDARIRKALSLSIDHEEYVKAMTGGKGEWALASAVPGLFSQQEIKQILKYDPEGAKRLVAEAGYPNGVELELIYPPQKYGQQHVTQVQLLQSQAKKGNINIKLQPVEDSVESKRQKQGDFQLDLLPNTIKAGDPDGILYAIYFSTSGSNYGRVKDPKLDKMLLDQRREMDPAKRKELIREIVRYVNDVPWGLGLYDGPEAWPVRPYVKGFAPNFAQLNDHHAETWLDR